MPKTRSDYRDEEIQFLIENAREGDSSSIEALLQTYQNYLSILASAQFRAKLNPRVSPSDVVQETLLGAHQKFGQFRGATEAELLAWLRKILINNLFKSVQRHIQAAQRDVRKEVALEQKLATQTDHSADRLANGLPGHEPTPSVNLQKQEAMTELADQLTQLPAAYRDVLIMRNLQELPFEQIANKMGRSTGATRMLWLRALDKLKQQYAEANHHD